MIMRRITGLLAILGVAASLLTSGCATNPVSKRSEFVLMSEDQELAIGRQMHAEVLQEYGEYKDPKLQAYVQQVGERVAALSDRPQLIYRFTVLDSPEVNAFALPGGYIYITRGILAYLNSEAELAAVLGHEIGHVTARHAVQQYSAAMAANVTFAIGSIFVPQLASRAGQSLFDTLGGALLSGYGRDHELEADRLGAEYLARTDYNPQAMIGVLTLLKNQEVFEKAQAKKEGRPARVYHGVFASHPSADQRLQQVVGEATPLRTVHDGRVERDPYLRHIDGLAFGDSEAQGIRRASDFYHRGLNFGLHFPPGWRLENSPDKLLAASPASDSLMQVQTAPRGGARTPQEYMVAQMRLQDLHGGQAFRVGPLPAYTGRARLQTPFGARDAPVGVVFLDQQAFRFFAAARTPGAALDRAFAATVKSLHVLTPAEQPLARAMRVALVTARPGDRFAALAGRSALRDDPEAVLRLVNGRYPQGEPAAGELVKLIH
jgi:predicted Zn-dependent protease